MVEQDLLRLEEPAGVLVITMPFQVPTKFSPGQTVSYKGGEYVIVRTPEGFKMKIGEEWFPGYLYTSRTTGIGFARVQADMEAKFEGAA